MSPFEDKIRRPCHLSYPQSVHSSFGRCISRPGVGWVLSYSYNPDGAPVTATPRAYTTSEQERVRAAVWSVPSLPIKPPHTYPAQSAPSFIDDNF